MPINQNAKMRKKNNIANKKHLSLQINLTAKDSILLKRYCELNSTTPKITIKKILHEFLLENVNMPEDEVENQLSLFEARETDLFDYIRG